MNELREVTFVYIGDTLPRYAHSALRLAADTSGLRTHLIASASAARGARGTKCDLTILEDFYDPAPFSIVSESIYAPTEFRSGFWLKTMERLFVLQQFMKVGGVGEILHAELDQLLFRLDSLLEKISDLTFSGLWLPFQTHEQVFASLLYCNDITSLGSFIEFAESGRVFPNEMVALNQWAKENPSEAVALPTVTNFLSISQKNGELPVSIASPNVTEIGGIVDPFQLGAWIGGFDPRNVGAGRPSVKWVDPWTPGLLSERQLASLGFSYPGAGGFFSVFGPNGDKTHVYNLHLHSKVHRWLESADSNIGKLVSLANSPKRSALPGTRRTHFMALIGTILLGIRKNPEKVLYRSSRVLAKLVGWRPSSRPFISGDSFRHFSSMVWEGNLGKAAEFDSCQRGDVVFCQSNLLRGFREAVVPRLRFPIVLLLGNSDTNFSRDSFAGLDRSVVGKVYAQNLAEDVEGVEVLPIGLENRWLNNHGRPSVFSRLTQNRAQKKPRILWGFNIFTNTEHRSEAARQLLSCRTADRLPVRLSSITHQRLLKTYSFVASPQGNGIDTHRTWEAMYLRCVPIIPRSYLAVKFEELGLPVWVVEDFSEIQEMSETDLASKYIEIEPKFDSPALWFRFWEDKITLSSESLKRD